MWVLKVWAHSVRGFARSKGDHRVSGGSKRNEQKSNSEEVSAEMRAVAWRHGFAVDAESLPNNVEVTHINLNDQTVEGMRHKELPIFSVQYHPEAAPGPHDASYFFQQFAKLIDDHR